jgi:hypothetical protein
MRLRKASYTLWLVSWPLMQPIEIHFNTKNYLLALKAIALLGMTEDSRVVSPSTVVYYRVKAKVVDHTACLDRRQNEEDDEFQNGDIESQQSSCLRAHLIEGNKIMRSML